jgi:hypothetical protein
MVPTVLLVLAEKKEMMVQRVIRVPRGKKVVPGNKVILEQLVQRVLKDLVEKRVTMDPKALKEKQALKALQDQRVIPAPLARKALQDQRETQVLLVRKDHKALKALWDQREIQVLLVPWAQLAPKVPPDS